jgi:hypothetical protein
VHADLHADLPRHDSGQQPTAITLNVEAAPLSAEDEASKYLAFAAYARLRGDTQAVGSALDTLIAHQPAMLEAQVEKADLLAAGGDYAGARAEVIEVTGIRAIHPKERSRVVIPVTREPGPLRSPRDWRGSTPTPREPERD